MKNAIARHASEIWSGYDTVSLSFRDDSMSQSSGVGHSEQHFCGDVESLLMVIMEMKRRGIARSEFGIHVETPVSTQSK